MSISDSVIAPMFCCAALQYRGLACRPSHSSLQNPITKVIDVYTICFQSDERVSASCIVHCSAFSPLSPQQGDTSDRQVLWPDNIGPISRDYCCLSVACTAFACAIADGLSCHRSPPQRQHYVPSFQTEICRQSTSCHPDPDISSTRASMLYWLLLPLEPSMEH